MGIAFLNSIDSNYISIENEGFELETEDLKKLRISLEAIEEQVPLYSYISLFISRENGTYTSSIQVNSFKRNFSAKVSSQDLWQSYKKTEKQINKQIRAWKRKRFLTPGFGAKCVQKTFDFFNIKEEENVK
jgi:hypothetical protein